MTDIPKFPFAAGLAGLILAACGMGEPVTIAEVEDKMREDFSDENAEVTWVSAEQAGEDENDYIVYLDVTEDGENSTKRCTVSMTSMSSSYSCQTQTPSMIDQAGQLLDNLYAERNIELENYEFERTGDGMAFGGVATIRNLANGARAEIECAGNHDEEDLNVDCDEDTIRVL